MIHFIVAINNDKIFESYLKSSISKFVSEKVSCIGIHNSPELNSMFTKYNFGIQQANPQDDDILIFVHEDVKIIDENLIPKLEMIFSKKPKVGLVGIVGTKELCSEGWWSNDYKHHVGHWIQEYDNGTQKHMVRKIGFDENMLVVDGCFFAVRGKVAKEVKFLEELYPKSFHFYDYSYCVSVLEAGWKVAVADIKILHKSEGPLSANWNDARRIFHNNLYSKGYKLPLTLEQIKTFKQ